MKFITLLLIIACCFADATAQSKKLFGSKRKNVEVPNYTLFLQLHDLAIEYSSKLEYKTDSLLRANNIAYDENIYEFRIRTLQSMQYVLYKSDPVIGFIDSWVYIAQMTNYLETPESKDHLSYSHTTFYSFFKEFGEEFPKIYQSLYGDPSVMAARVDDFVSTYPIIDPHQNRTSITLTTAQWVGEARIGFKSGVATLTDAMRNISDRLNYNAEFTPKIVGWNIERNITRLMGTDSIGPILARSVSALDRITNQVDSIDYVLYGLTDSVFAEIDRQRRESLFYLSSERNEVMDRMSSERAVLVSQLVQERLAFEKLIQQEREASLIHVQEMIMDTTKYGFDRVDKLANQIFFKLLILVSILVAGMVLAVFLYKRM